ncbi:MAG: alpha/beta fold hydrolase [Desulfobacterales bacterium]
MSSHQINRRNYSTNVRIFNIKRKAVESLITILWHLAPAFTQQKIADLFFAPTRPRLSTDQSLMIDQGRPLQATVHGKTIRGWRWGQGPGILLAHGWNGCGIQLHGLITPLVRAGYTAIAFDALGHGRSDGHTSSYFEYTDTLRLVVDPETGFRIQGFVGHSLGAAALVNTIDKEHLSLPAVLIAPPLRLRELLHDILGQWGIPAPVYKTLIAQYEQRFGYNLNHDDPLRLLGRLNAPVLIIHDRDDRIVPFRDSKAAAKNNRHVRLHLTEGLGHKGVLTDPGVAAAALDHLSRPQAKAQ